MERVWKRLGVAAVAAGLLVGYGCDDRPPVTSSSEEATVTGTVTINGKPASKGKVVFDPANYQRKDVSARDAEIGEGGKYTITTLVGSNMVRVDSAEAAKAGASYASITCDVKPGTNTFDITLPPQ